MAEVITDGKNYSNIANAIRSRTGEDRGFLPSEMAEAIGSIEGSGNNEEDVKNYIQGTFETVTIPEGLDHIHNYAFYKNENLTTVIMPSNAEDLVLNSNCFSNCVKLENIDLSKIKKLGLNCFEATKNLKNVEINPSDGLIPSYTFRRSGIENIVSSCTQIDVQAFYECKSLNISKNSFLNLELVHSSAFSYCNFEEVDFSLCENFNEDTFSLGYAFSSCENLKKIILPNHTNYNLGPASFSYCSSMTELPNNILSIGSWCFQSCKGFIEIIIPETILVIGEKAFINCSNLEKITFKHTTQLPSMNNSDIFLGCDKLIEINVPWKKGEVAYAPWGATNTTINYNVSV